MGKKRARRKKEDEEMSRGQMWSVDVVIGIVIFLTIITVFYSTLSETSNDSWDKLKLNADTLITKFSQDPNLRIIEEGNILNISRLETLVNMSYNDLKRQIGVEGDFCIYLMDETGRLLPIGSKTSIGSPKVNVSGSPCGSYTS